MMGPHAISAIWVTPTTHRPVAVIYAAVDVSVVSMVIQSTMIIVQCRGNSPINPLQPILHLSNIVMHVRRIQKFK